MRFIVRFISIVAFVRIDFVAATKAIPNSIFIAMVTGDTTPAWFEVNNSNPMRKFKLISYHRVWPQ